MRIKKIGIWAGLILSLLIMGVKTPVYAADSGYAAVKSDSVKMITDLRLTSLDEPVPGVPLDTKATIVSAEGVTWDIPVVWIDESGKTVTVAETGKKYYPSFIFYIPSGYKVAGTDRTGSFAIRIPNFVMKLSGSTGLVFAADPSTGITYILPNGTLTAATAALYPAQSSTVATVHDYASYDEQEDDSYVFGSSAPVPAAVSAPYVSDIVRMYCADSAINTLGNDFLEDLIGVLKNTLIPQAANVLRDKFPQSFGAARPGTDLSSEIGLYVYYREGSIDDMATPEGALAFVMAGGDNTVFYNIMGMDASSYTEYDSLTGSWYIPWEQVPDLNGTIVHEMLHAFMYDYNRYGMILARENNEQRFPLWFAEGLATAVEDAYSCRATSFMQLTGKQNNGQLSDVDEDLVLNGYLNPYLVEEYGNEFLMDLAYSDTPNNASSAYASGYLAVTYLGYMDASSRGLTVYDANGDFNVDSIRNGLDDILFRLHGSDTTPAQTLDSIISSISDNRYSSTADYQNRFIKGVRGEDDSYNGDINDAGDTGSLAFVRDYLLWLGSSSDAVRVLANGNLLYQDQQDHSLALNWDQPTISPVYNVLDDSGLSRSSVDSTRAAQTGSTSTVGVVSDGEESAGISPDMSAAADYRPDEVSLYETSDDYSQAITEESVRSELVMTDEQISATTPSEEGTEESSQEDTEEPSADEDTGVTEQSEDAMTE